jgi:hypothetical protein
MRPTTAAAAVPLPLGVAAHDAVAARCTRAIVEVVVVVVVVVVVRVDCVKVARPKRRAKIGGGGAAGADLPVSCQAQFRALPAAFCRAGRLESVDAHHGIGLRRIERYPRRVALVPNEDIVLFHLGRGGGGGGDRRGKGREGEEKRSRGGGGGNALRVVGVRTIFHGSAEA